MVKTLNLDNGGNQFELCVEASSLIVSMFVNARERVVVIMKSTYPPIPHLCAVKCEVFYAMIPSSQKRLHCVRMVPLTIGARLFNFTDLNWKLANIQ